MSSVFIYHIHIIHMQYTERECVDRKWVIQYCTLYNVNIFKLYNNRNIFS